MSPSIRQERAYLLLAIAAFASVAGLLLYRILIVPDAWILMDFRTNLYYPALALLEGHDPYDVAALVQRYPIVPPIPPYAPLVLLAHAPFALLPVAVAQLLYVALTMGLTLALAAFALRAVRPASSAAAVVGLAALLLVSRPGSMNMLLGQPTLIVVLATSVALLHTRTHPVWAAIGVAMATCKPQFGVPLALLLAFGGAARVAVGGVLVSGVITLLTLLAIAHGDVRVMLDMLAALPRNATHIDDATFTWWSRIDLPYLASHVAAVASGASPSSRWHHSSSASRSRACRRVGRPRSRIRSGRSSSPASRSCSASTIRPTTPCC